MKDKPAAACSREAILPTLARGLVPRRLQISQRGRMAPVEVAAPQQDPLISACGCQAAAIWREGSSQHSALMCAQSVAEAALAQVPELQAAIQTAGQQDRPPAC